MQGRADGAAEPRLTKMDDLQKDAGGSHARQIKPRAPYIGFTMINY